MNSFAWPDSDQGGLHAFLSLVVIQGPLLLPAFQWPMKTKSTLGYVEFWFFLRASHQGGGDSPGSPVVENMPSNAGYADLIPDCSSDGSLRYRRLGFNPWVGKIPWRREWQPIYVSSILA